MENFGEWLTEELNKRGWSRAELARRSKISESTLSLIVSGQRGVGKDTAQAIAKTLGLPGETVFRAAGLLPPLTDRHAVAEEIIKYKLSRLNEEHQVDVLTFIEFLQAKEEMEQSTSIKTWEVNAPPKSTKKSKTKSNEYLTD